MKTSPLQLDDAFVVEVSIKESSRYAGVTINPADIQVVAQPHFTQSLENPRKWEVDLAVTFSGSDEKPLPYHGRLISRGFFTISESFKEESRMHVVAANCPAILYSTAREVLAMLTGRCRFGRMLLPSMTFIDEKGRFDPPPPEIKNETECSNEESGHESGSGITPSEPGD